MSMKCLSEREVASGANLSDCWRRFNLQARDGGGDLCNWSLVGVRSLFISLPALEWTPEDAATIMSRQKIGIGNLLKTRH